METKNYDKLKNYYVGVFEGLQSLGIFYFSEHQTPEEKAKAAIETGYWDVKILLPSSAAALNRIGYLNVGICPLCGESPIGKDRTWKYAWDWNNGTNLNLCESCYRKGKKEIGSGSKGCYVATICYGSGYSENVTMLKLYRDRILINNIFGRTFIKIYYSISPYLANFLRNKEFLNKFIKYFFLNPFSEYIIKRYNFKERYCNKNN